MSAVSAVSPVWVQWVRVEGMVVARRRCCWRGRGAPRSRRAPPACRRRPPPCHARRGNPPPETQDTTGWSIEMRGRTRMGQGLLHRAHRAALRCRTTRSASCRQYRRPRRCRRRSPESRSFGPAIPACPRPPSSRSTQQPGDGQLSQRRIINARIITGFSFNENIRLLRI